MQALRDHVEAFNAAVSAGNFGPMLAGFADDAELVFVGVPVGPFHGREAIEQAYLVQPPDDEILLLDEREEDGELVGGYAWKRHPDVRAGELRLTVVDGRTRRLVVSFD
jgi:steroid Delta-isomerase